MFCALERQRGARVDDLVLILEVIYTSDVTPVELALLEDWRVISSIMAIVCLQA